MKIIIESIPHTKQRYLTSGDYWLEKDGTIQVRVSTCKNPKYEWLTMIHELVELMLTKFQNVPWESIDKFDKMVNKERMNPDPGSESDAPYYHQHHIATAIEQLLAEELGVNWEQYNNSEYDS